MHISSSYPIIIDICDGEYHGSINEYLSSGVSQPSDSYCGISRDIYGGIYPVKVLITMFFRMLLTKPQQ